ncbi:MAG: beta-phosphoglucomutase [Lachnospira sp.]|nr:beta-phosphoglucomutase [Lachnospira sp.]
MRYKAIIFDMDGVLCFTDKYHYRAWKQMADKIDVYFDEKINNRLRGVSRMESLNIILKKADKEYSEQEKEQLADSKNEIYKKLLMNMTSEDFSREVRDTLDLLRSRGYKLAIGSSSKNAKLILKQVGLQDYFDKISDGTNITKSKPDPEVFLKAAEYLNVKPEECLVVEDAKAGINAACAGGFDSVGIGEASGYEKTTYSIAHFSQLANLDKLKR